MTENINNNNGTFVPVTTVASFLEVSEASVVSYIADVLPESMLDMVSVNERGFVSKIHSDLIPEFRLGLWVSA